MNRFERKLAASSITMMVFAVCLLIAWASGLGPGGWSIPPVSAQLAPHDEFPHFDEDEWHSTQMHIHGWSNHNAGSQPASVQLHTDWAHDAGLDVIWWSEYNKVFTQDTDFTINLPEATISNTLDIQMPPPPDTHIYMIGWQVGWLAASTSADGSQSVALEDGSLRMSAHGEGTDYSWLTYRAMRNPSTNLRGHGLVRPLASDPVLGLDVSLCVDSGPDAYAQMELGLSWHDYGQPRSQSLVYRFVDPDQPASVIIGTHRVTTTVPLTGTHVELPLLDGVSVLQDGNDNAIQELYFSVGGREGAESCMEISNFNLHSHQPDAVSNVADHHATISDYQSRYQVVGLEGWEQNAGLRHLNPYLPSDAGLVPGWDDVQARDFVPLIHDNGGLVALNHPFGATYGAPLPDDEQEAIVQDLLDILLPVSAWHVDILEIYRNRANIDWNHHIRFWDLLAINQVPLCGIAASDQHSGPFVPGRASMVSWIEATESSQDAMLHGLRRCRVFFGDLALFDGALDLRLADTLMGGVYPVHDGQALLDVHIDPWPDDVQVQLVQVLESPGRDLVYLRDHEPISAGQPVLIDTGQPSFVRIEVRDLSGYPIVFSNRIYIRDIQCDVNDDGTVSIADVQTVAGMFNLSVPPASPAADLQKDGIIDIRDVIVAAQCWTDHVGEMR